MAKLMVTWLGEDELHKQTTQDASGKEVTQPVPGPSYTTWGKTRFEKGKSVLIDTDAPDLGTEEKKILEQIIVRAPKNRFFKTEPVTEKPERAAPKG